MLLLVKWLTVRPFGKWGCKLFEKDKDGFLRNLFGLSQLGAWSGHKDARGIRLAPLYVHSDTSRPCFYMTPILQQTTLHERKYKFTCLLCQHARGLPKLVENQRRTRKWGLETVLNLPTLKTSKAQPCQRHEAIQGSGGMAPLILNFGIGWKGWSKSRRGRFTPGKEPRHPSNKTLIGPQIYSGRFRAVKDLLPLTGFESGSFSCWHFPF